MNFKKVVVPAHTAVIIRELVPANEMQDYFARTGDVLMEMVNSAGIPAPQSMRTYYYSGPGETFDMANGLVLADEHLAAITVPEGAEIVTFPEATALQTEVAGSYSQLPDAWMELSTEISARGYTPGLMSFEDYLNVPCDVPEEELRTLVVWEVV